jgi:GNAT superfamily N-acetyltransferase
MQPDGNYIIRRMTSSEVDFAVSLAAEEGWNPGLFDAQCFYQTDPGGFLIGILDNGPIGCISAVSYEHKYGFIGFYIVIREFRGKGYGIQLWQAAMKHLAGQNIGLDGVIDQESNYVKSGFRKAYRNFRFEGRASGLMVPGGREIVKLKEMPLGTVAQYDRRCFPAERSLFLHCWLNLPSSTPLGYVERDSLKGYGVIRKCRRGYKIGPLFADSLDVADQLYSCLASTAGKDEPVFLDIPEANARALDMVQKHKMREVFSTVRMYSQGKPELALEKVFGVTTFELG